MMSDSELGTIEFVRSPRATHIHVRILPSGLKVSLPSVSTREQALEFIESIRAKLLKKQADIGKKLQKNPVHIDENTPLQTLTFKVVACVRQRENIHFSLKNNILSIEYPLHANCAEKRTQESFWQGISYFLKKEAKRILPERTKQLAQQHGFQFADVKIQSSKTRWGSCSGKQNINLSFYLLLLPYHLVDYVILHELCHTREMNHGVNFWRWMDKVTDNKSKEFRAELKKYHMPQ
ncbi:MAG TPA: SprT-like domain-containing protein [Paludibacter sp.]|nr:SprT-like domain-containing protein [Paludibacter sp.]